MKIHIVSVGIILTLFASLCSAALDPFSYNEHIITYVLVNFRISCTETRQTIQRDLFRPDYQAGCPYEYGSNEYFAWALAGYPTPWYDWAYPPHYGDPDRYIRPGVYRLFDLPIGLKGTNFAYFPFSTRKGPFCREGTQRMLAHNYMDASAPSPWAVNYHIEKGDFISDSPYPENVLHVQSLNEPELREYTAYQRYIDVKNMLAEMYERQKIAENWRELQTSIFECRPISYTEINDEWVHGNNTGIDAVTLLDAATTLLCVLPEARTAKYTEVFNTIIQRLRTGEGKGVDVFVNSFEEADAVLYAAQPTLRWRYAYETYSGTPMLGFKELHLADNSVGLPHIRYWAKNEQGAWMTGHVYYRTDMLPVEKLSTAVNEDQAQFSEMFWPSTSTNPTLRGGWDSFCGTKGIYIPGHLKVLPKYIQITPVGANVSGYTVSNRDTRFLKALGIVNAGGTNQTVKIVDRRVGTFLHARNDREFKIVVNCKNSVMKNPMSIYFVDPTDSNPQTVEIRDTISDELLDQRVVTGINKGVWLKWSIRGLVTIRITREHGTARLSGIFID